jgi:iron complex transport system ATP-binding protein
MARRNQQDSIYLVTGSVQGGKTTYLSQLSELLKEKNLNISGFLCPGSFEAGERAGFTLQNIKNGKQVALATALETPEWTPYKRFWFNPEAFRLGREWIRECLTQLPDVLIIDEVGPMELEGSGWSDILETVGNSSVPVQIWNVRERLIGEVMKHWSIPPPNVIRIEEVELNQAAKQISETVIRKRK